MGMYEKEASTSPSLEEASTAYPQSTEAHYHTIDVFGPEVGLFGAHSSLLNSTIAVLTRTG